MDDLVLKYGIQYIIAPVIIGLGIWVMKSMVFNRLDKLEETVPKKVDEAKVRQILDDKLEGIKDDVCDIKQQLNIIYQLLIKKN